MSQKLVETIIAKPILEETQREKLPEGVLCRVTYPICNIGERNANSRVYEDAVWDKVMGENDLKEKLASRALFGHAEHPEQTQSNLEKTSHVIFEMWKDDGKIWQKMDVLNTPTGRIVDTLLRADCQVGVSTRAEGDLEEAEDDKGTYQRVVPESYRYVTTDFTADPSTFGVIPQDVKRNIISDVKKELENEKLNGSEYEFAQLILESISCKDSKCVIEGAKKIASKVRKVVKESTVQEAIEDGTIKVGTKVKYGDKNAKVEKIEETNVNLTVLLTPESEGVGVGITGDSSITVDPEGTITIVPVEKVESPAVLAPKPAEEIEEEMYTCECLKCGYTMESGEHCREIKCPKCGGEMRRKERPGTGWVGEELPEEQVMGPEHTIEVGDTIEVRNLENTKTIVPASKVTEVGTMIGDKDTEFHKVKTEEGGDRWYEAEAYTLVRVNEKVNEQGEPLIDRSRFREGDIVQDKKGVIYIVRSASSIGIIIGGIKDHGAVGVTKFIEWDDVKEMGLRKIAESMDEQEDSKFPEIGDEITHKGRIGKVIAKGGAKGSYKVHFEDTDEDEWVDLSETKVNETKAIKKLYRDAGLTPPDGKGIHTEAFHKCVVGYADKIKSGEITQGEACQRCMGALGPEKAVKKAHRKKKESIGEATEAELPFNIGDEFEYEGKRYRLVDVDITQPFIDRPPTISAIIGEDAKGEIVHIDSDDFIRVRVIGTVTDDARGSISTTAKEIKDLRVKEASTRAERDKALELLEELAGKSERQMSLESKMLISKVKKAVEARDKEVDALRAKLEEKAKLSSSLQKKIEELKKDLATVKVNLVTDIRELEEAVRITKEKRQNEIEQLKSEHIREIEQLRQQHNESTEQLKKDFNRKIVEEAKEARREVTDSFIKNFATLRLEEAGLKVDDNSQALLEKCSTLEEVDDLFEEILDASRRSALHSEVVTSVKIGKPIVDPEQAEADRQVGSIFEGMNKM